MEIPKMPSSDTNISTAIAAKMPLTDIAVRNARQAPKPYKLSDGGGLYLLVTPTGGKLWRHNYRHGAKQLTASYGAYPAVTLAVAREKRDATKRQLAEGKNPAIEKKRVALAAKIAASNTFSTVAEELIVKLEREGRASTTADKLRWYASLLETIEDRPVGEIEAFELLEPLKKIEASGRYETAVNTLSFAGRVFRFAVATGRAKRDVAADLRGALTTPKVTHRAAILDAKGAGRLLRAIEEHTGQRHIKIALQLMAHTFPRPGELRAATWDEFDLGKAVWRIPAHRTKMRREHTIPLSTQVVAMLQNLQKLTGEKAKGAKLAFPSLRSPGKPISENTLNISLRAMGFGADEMTSHGFRSMASTLLNESGKWNPDAIERALAHGDSDAVRGSYHRGAYWDERVRMAQWWSDYLDALRDGADILPFKRGA